MENKCFKVVENVDVLNLPSDIPLLHSHPYWLSCEEINLQ